MIGKKERIKMIDRVVNGLTAVDRNTPDDVPPFVVELCEILEGQDFKKIQRDVGEMSVNQWGEALKFDLATSIRAFDQAVALSRLCSTILDDLEAFGSENVEAYRKQLNKIQEGS